VDHRRYIGCDANTEQYNSHTCTSMTVLTPICGRLVWWSVGKKM